MLMLLLILTAGLVPVAVGLFQLAKAPKGVWRTLGAALPAAASLFCALAVACGGLRGERVIFAITHDLRFVFAADTAACFFAVLFSAAFLVTAVFSGGYFSEDARKNRFDGFFLITLGALMFLAFSGNLLSMYICFEAVTLCSMPLVLHDKTRESVDAALKYLLYSVGGAFLGFLGVVYFSMHLTADRFVFGGVLQSGVADTKAFSVIFLLTVIGFGAKCGVFPLHNWLPTAHPVAPAPASALLSGIITKSGVVALLRIVYYTVGAEAIRGTAVHRVWLILILFTILLGSFMAAVQQNFKRRLAYSTVSQVSYVLLGIALLSPDALSGAFLQILSHAVIKIGLFLAAGAVIHLLGKHEVDELSGVGRQMPVTMACYTVLSLGLVGVPPTSGFVAKWYLATGALQSELGAFAVIAPAVLIVSAILTAYYLLSCTVKAFFPTDKAQTFVRVREPLALTVPMLLLAALSVLLGLFAEPVTALLGTL